MTCEHFQRIPFLAAGRSLDAVRAFLETRAAQNDDARQLVRAALGLDETAKVLLITQGSRFAGFNLDLGSGETVDAQAALFFHVAQVARGRTEAGERFLEPRRRTKAGKAFANAFAAFQRPSSWSFTESMGLKVLLLRSAGRIAGASFENIGERYVIQIPHHPDAVCEDTNTPVPKVQVPPDAVELRLSEYHRMKEEVADAKAAQP